MENIIKVDKPTAIFYRLLVDKGEYKEVSAKGGIVVALRPDGDTVHLGIAVCSILDNFEKERGTTKAHGRSLAKNSMVLSDINVDTTWLDAHIKAVWDNTIMNIYKDYDYDLNKLELTRAYKGHGNPIMKEKMIEALAEKEKRIKK